MRNVRTALILAAGLTIGYLLAPRAVRAGGTATLEERQVRALETIAQTSYIAATRGCR